MTYRSPLWLACALFHVVATTHVLADEPIGALPDNDTVMKAMAEELGRSMEDLSLGDLPTPYFIQYTAEDRLTFTMKAAYGALLRSDTNRYRVANSRVRVGSFELDNTNAGRGIGGRSTLPLDDELGALRHSIWKMTDADYKRAIEMLVRKQAYLRQKTDTKRPNDFAPAEPVVAIEPSAEIAFDRDHWQATVEKLSARFKDYPAIQDSHVSFFAGAVNSWVANSEGTRIRRADRGVYLECQAETQAQDGMRVSDRTSYLALDIDGLPAPDQVLEDIDKLCTNLIELSKAPVLEHYTGPVLFEPVAAGQVLSSLLSDRFCARPIPLGTSGSPSQSFDNKIGRRVLPKTFQVYDDPNPMTFEDTILAGSYTFDDEGMRPQRVELVRDGKLRTLLASRAPTRKIKQTTGHARTSGFGDPKAHIGCLYFTDAKGLSADELKAKLIEAVQDEGLEYGIRVQSLQPGGYGSIGNPRHFFKVYENGREERIRGMEFAIVQVNSLKRLIAAGKERNVYNTTTGISSSVISPAILFDELELNKIEREFDKPPILKSPAERGGTS